jgi:hypothetical protein
VKFSDPTLLIADIGTEVFTEAVVLLLVFWLVIP